MVDAQTQNPSADEIQLSKEQEEEARKLFGENFLALTSSEQARLSKVLFPETDLDTVEILGKKRTIRPLPLKISKQAFAVLEPFAAAHKKAEEAKGEQISLNEDIIFALGEFAKVLAKFYEWEDVLKAAEEEGLTVSELQELAVKQQHRSGANDFLLSSVRLLVNVMRLHEILNVKFASTLSMPPSAKSSNAL